MCLAELCGPLSEGKLLLGGNMRISRCVICSAQRRATKSAATSRLTWVLAREDNA